MEVYVDDDTKLTLHGLKQHYVKLQDREKNRKLFDLLDALEFNQVIIFVKTVQRCVALTQLLNEQNFPAICIHRGMDQAERWVLVCGSGYVLHRNTDALTLPKFKIPGEPIMPEIKWLCPGENQWRCALRFIVLS